MINLIERTASSFAGIGISTIPGSQLVSRIAITVMPSFLHSAIAVLSRFGSTTIASPELESFQSNHLNYV